MCWPLWDFSRSSRTMRMPMAQNSPAARPANGMPTLAGSDQRLADFQMSRGFDLDDIGAPVGELAHAGRTRAHPGQIQHRETRKGLRGPWKRHSVNSRSGTCARTMGGLTTFPDPNGIVYALTGSPRPDAIAARRV